MKTLRILGLWGPVVAFMVLIYALATPGSVPAPSGSWDKLLHAAAYGLFGALCLRAFHGGFRRLRLAPTLCAVVLALTYAMIDEMHQSRIPGRHASVLDWLADGVGVALALGIVAWLTARRSDAAASARHALDERGSG